MSDKALELITMKRQNAVNQVKKSNRIYFFSLLLLLVILQQRRIIFFLYFGGRQLDKILQYPLTASRTNQKELNEYKFLYQQMKSE